MRDHWAGQYPLGRTGSGPDGDQTGEAYLIRQDVWKDIERDTERIVYPTAFGDKPRTALAIRKAAEWKAWLKVISAAVLQGHLPEPYYHEWINLAKATTLATDYSTHSVDIPRLRNMMVGFVAHYEDLYYKRKQVRLPACRAVFHALLHVADCVEWLGPMWPHAQWTMERMCGQWVPKVKQKQQADRNLSLALLRDSLSRSVSPKGWPTCARTPDAYYSAPTEELQW